MNYAILVSAAPFSTQGAHNAINFCEAAIDAGHRIARVFFYQDGVHNASALACPPQDEPPLTPRWQALHTTHGTDLVVCIAAAQRRGLLDEDEARRHDKPAANLAGHFRLSGLGQLAEAAIEADRVVAFHA
ncbi:sulfurtransferase complex subunit TusD [Granulosicoccaceae sp. 1_MG-2023]|nr:sulfurtransferase complex subunit TusD [Granulosicoccaceae sp. 1_MG-2023]